MNRLSIIIVCIAMTLGFAFSTLRAVEPAGKPAEEKVHKKVQNVPNTTVRDMKYYFKPKSKPKSQKHYINMMDAQLAKIIKLGESAEAEYPNATNLDQVQNLMFQAAKYRTHIRNTPARRKKLVEIAEKIIANKKTVSTPVRLMADYYVIEKKTTPIKGKALKDAGKTIRGFYKRYEKKYPAETAIYTAQLAKKAKLPKLTDEMATILEKKHADKKGVFQLLMALGRGPVFKAQLIRIDGKKLNLPEDLQGKVVVIDFWATWCGPCIRGIPHLKKVYAEYKPKGVEIIGISLDKNHDKNKLKSFIKQNDMSWIHTFSGKAWGDPTARKYGIRGIPSIWVIGKDGRIVSSNARSNLEATIEKALKTAGNRQ